MSHLEALGDLVEIVFVHFGPTLPKHLILNIRRTCELFPDHQVVLLTDRVQENEIVMENFCVQQASIHPEHSEIESKLNHPKDFRNNFWFASLVRLTAICNYTIEKKSPVLHIESDVLISHDFPLSKFSELDRAIAYTIIGDGFGVASIFWINSPMSAKLLKNFITEEVKKDSNTTDMKILGLFQTREEAQVRVLASFPLNPRAAHSAIPISIEKDFEYTRKILGGYFDAADIGQYLLGDDPRNHRGIKYLRRELPSSYLRPSKLRYSYSEDRAFLNIGANSEEKLFSLHIHSKNKGAFYPKKGLKIMQQAVKNQSKHEKHIFMVQVFLNSFTKAINRRIRNTSKVFRND